MKTTPATQWQIFDSQHHDNDETLINTVIEVFSQLYKNYFADEMLVNHKFSIEIRAFRHTDPWYIFLLLTPWMLARLFIPDRNPAIPLPQGWQATERVNAPLMVIGPPIPLAILGGLEQAHLNYHPTLGHYLLQPLVQSLEQFDTPDEVFNAWNEVIKTRNRIIEEKQRQCEWHQEVSRREFFAALRKRASPQ